MERGEFSGQGYWVRLAGPPPMPGSFLFYSTRPESIAVQSYEVAEEQAREVMECFHPTEESEELRRDVTEYLQKLIGRRLSCQVFPYGSVPLKTYLPRGDIDLTVISKTSDQKDMAQKVRAILEEEEKNEAAEFIVKSIQFIDAEVKLVKCVVQDIRIDISLNQLGGLCALCFLEEVDNYFGRDHLFKRSILLIKSWCFYESHILGANRGFLSTYALEIMVLLIFQMFSKSIRGPLMALHRFLDYYSKFDWDAYGINLRGPVSIPLLGMPNVFSAEFIPGNCRRNFPFCDKFLSWLMDTYSVPRKDLASDARVFRSKVMNIVDPLQPHNNLGRSVSLENSRTVRGELEYGAQMLGHILLLPRETLAGEVRNFLTRGMEKYLTISHSFPSSLKELYFGDSGSGDISALNKAETDCAENPELWHPLLDLAGDHAANVRNLVDAQLTHGYNSSVAARPYHLSFPYPVLNRRPSLGGTAWVPVPPQCYTHNAVPVPPAQAHTFLHPSLRSCGSRLGDNQRPPRGLGSTVPKQNASSSNGDSSQWRGKEKVTENHRQVKSLASRNGHDTGSKKQSSEEGLLRPSKSDSAQSDDGSVSDAGLFPKIQFGSFGDSLERSGQEESSVRIIGGSTRSSVTPVEWNSNANTQNRDAAEENFQLVKPLVTKVYTRRNKTKGGSHKLFFET